LETADDQIASSLDPNNAYFAYFENKMSVGTQLGSKLFGTQIIYLQNM